MNHPSDPDSILPVDEQVEAVVAQAVTTLLPDLPPTRMRRFAHWVSTLLSPTALAVVTVVLAGMNIHNRQGWLWILAMAFGLIGLPSLYLFWLLKRGKITDYDVFLRQQRYKPYFVMLACFMGTLIVMLLGRAPEILITLALAVSVMTTIMMCINFRWKISAHAAAAASFAIMTIQLIGMAASPVFLAVPLVAWSRVTLKRHTLGQTIGGALLGTGVYTLAFILR